MEYIKTKRFKRLKKLYLKEDDEIERKRCSEACNWPKCTVDNCQMVVQNQ